METTDDEGAAAGAGTRRSSNGSSGGGGGGVNDLLSDPLNAGINGIVEGAMREASRKFGKKGGKGGEGGVEEVEEVEEVVVRAAEERARQKEIGRASIQTLLGQAREGSAAMGAAASKEQVRTGTEKRVRGARRKEGEGRVMCVSYSSSCVHIVVVSTPPPHTHTHTQVHTYSCTNVGISTTGFTGAPAKSTAAEAGEHWE
jgi:hypothetical protein